MIPYKLSQNDIELIINSLDIVIDRLNNQIAQIEQDHRHRKDLTPNLRNVLSEYNQLMDNMLFCR
jgi:hypothetical protein